MTKERKQLLVAAVWLAGLGVLAGPTAFAAEIAPLDMEVPRIVTRLTHFPSNGSALEVEAVFRTPIGGGKFPAVIVVHGSTGMDSRGHLHARDLANAGIASLEIDMWGARGLSGGAKGRPSSPLDTMPDLWGAEAWLAKQPEIDAKRIGVMGFSWRGSNDDVIGYPGKWRTTGRGARACGVCSVLPNMLDLQS